MYYAVTRTDELQHHGVKGMKWGVRRYQNADGTLTEAGKRRYMNSDGTLTKAGIKKYSKDVKKAFNNNKVPAFAASLGVQSKSFGKNTEKIVEKYKKEANDTDEERYLNNLDKEAAALNKKYKGRYDDPDVQEKIRDFRSKYLEAAAANTAKGKEIAKKYIKDFNSALVKDLEIPDSENVEKYINDNMRLWDATYISNYAWFNQLT